ncbi:hypothetical protein CQ056_09230 [Peribacillus simplex]|nr:hypothetical protein CQ056_09230 [Peribacillus simplex]
MHPIPCTFLSLKKNIGILKPAISLLNIILKKRLTGNFRFRDNDAEINPYKHSPFLIEKAVSKGVRVYATTKINEKIENQTQLFTETCHTVHAQTVIFAIGYEAQEEVKDKMQ